PRLSCCSAGSPSATRRERRSTVGRTGTSAALPYQVSARVDLPVGGDDHSRAHPPRRGTAGLAPAFGDLALAQLAGPAAPARPSPAGMGLAVPIEFRRGVGGLVPKSSVVPGLGAALSYRREWLGKDLVAGVVLTTLLVPQGMAYAELAGLPPITGLY